MAALDHRHKALPTEGVKHVIRNYRFRAYPNQALQAHLAKVFGCTRFVYNRTLGMAKDTYTSHLADPENTPKPNVSYPGLSKTLTSIKQSDGYQWLYEVSKGPLQTSVSNLADAFKAFFAKRSSHPRFKSKHGEQSAYYPDGCFTIQDGQLYLAKTDSPLKLKASRAVPTYPIGCTVTKTVTGKYFVTLTVSVPVTRKAGQGTIGIDLGIKDYVTLSDGTKATNPRHYLTLQRKLAHAQRMLSKKAPGSNSRHEQRLIVAKLHERITNARKDTLHKLSTQIVLENQAIVMEALKVANMLRNHKLAKHIADASWSMFKQMVMYKVQETLTGCLIVANTYFPSTQLCSTCGTQPQVKLPLSAREWECPSCHSHHDRDVNAAMNLQLLGERVLALVAKGLIPQGKQIYLSSDYGTLVH